MQHANGPSPSPQPALYARRHAWTTPAFRWSETCGRVIGGDKAGRYTESAMWANTVANGPIFRMVRTPLLVRDTHAWGWERLRRRGRPTQGARAMGTLGVMMEPLQAMKCVCRSRGPCMGPRTGQQLSCGREIQGSNARGGHGNIGSDDGTVTSHEVCVCVCVCRSRGPCMGPRTGQQLSCGREIQGSSVRGRTVRAQSWQPRQQCHGTTEQPWQQ